MEHLNHGICRQYREKGIVPWCCCPDTEEQVLQAIESGTCNDPTVALDILKKKGLHP